MNSTLLKQALGTSLSSAVGELHVYPDIDSTNAESMRLLRSSGFTNRLIVARSQSAGRGRRGRVWESPRDAGLYLSITRILSGRTSLQALSLVTALAVRAALASLGLEGLQLKWPNDLLVKQAKLAGVLLEVSREQDKVALVFGIGINQKFTAETRAVIAQPVVDLNSVMSQLPSSEAIIAAICRQLFPRINLYLERGFAPFREEWNSHDCYLGELIRIVEGDRQQTGRHAGVDDSGALRIQTVNGMDTIRGGEVFPSLRPVETSQ